MSWERFEWLWYEELWLLICNCMDVLVCQIDYLWLACLCLFVTAFVGEGSDARGFPGLCVRCLLEGWSSFGPTEVSSGWNPWKGGPAPECAPDASLEWGTGWCTKNLLPRFYFLVVWHYLFYLARRENVRVGSIMKYGVNEVSWRVIVWNMGWFHVMRWM